MIWSNFTLEIWRFEKRIALSEKKPPLVPVVYFAEPDKTSLWVVWAEQHPQYT